jgi:hypothetical protein
MSFSRRSFLAAAPAGGFFLASAAAAPAKAAADLPAMFPAHDPDLAREMVSVSHGKAARVRELLEGRPALANASWDWGYGDWETALGGASHIGNREIAELLLAAGAPPTIFSAAMLGQLAVVQALVAARPGVQRVKGPHGIPLLDHARNGGATEVVKYLPHRGGAGPAGGGRAVRRDRPGRRP